MSIKAQEKIVYPSHVLGTTLEVSSKAKVKTFEVEGSQVEMFMVLSDANGFQYTLTVTKSIDDEIVFKDFKDDK